MKPPLTVIPGVLTCVVDFGFLFDIDECISLSLLFPQLNSRSVRDSYGPE